MAGMVSSPLVAPGAGLVLLQGQRLEDLAETVLQWLGQRPLGLLEEETLLVPSNGMGEWFKIQAAQTLGVCAGMRMELPARWAWQLVRRVLGSGSAPPASPFDKRPLAWWLAARWAEFQHLQGLPSPGEGDELARVRWCTRAADLFDQYQLFRADWLADWEAGRLVLKLQAQDQACTAVPDSSAWQAALWAWIVRRHEAEGGQPSRAAQLQEAINRLRSGHPEAVAALPRRLVVFGASNLPPLILDLLAALSLHRPVLFAIPNPCRVQWVDLAQGPRQGHPLLAAWGRQVGDFIRQLERFDDRLERLEGRRMARAERDEDAPSLTALARLQGAIVDNENPAEASSAAPCATKLQELSDGSIRLHRAHTALREVEALHDHLLRLFDAPQPNHLVPRDVVVMLPELETHAAAITAVFGKHPPGDARHIPWGFADQRAPIGMGLSAVVEWLLSLPGRRASLEELERLLRTPALAARWSLDEEECQRLLDWTEAAGVRWGLSAAHRGLLGLGQAGASQTWEAGAQRLLAGYALGSHAQAGLDVEPWPEARGLRARAAGIFAALVRRLDNWVAEANRAATPQEWGQRIRGLLGSMFEPADEQEQRVLAAFEAALAQWLQDTQRAGFKAPVGWRVVHEALMSGYAEPPPKARFRAGGVTFCTLLPLRAVPFEVVCLLGMNEGAYPRPSAPAGDDLMARPELARPGDRSRRLDDRQLLLDALLSARRHLLVSWVGRRVHDNEQQPPSVLVGQLLDTLEATWGAQAVERITFDLPLQPFSARHFEDSPLGGTYAAEWRLSALQASASRRESPEPAPEEDWLADPTEVQAWLRQPVARFDHRRLGIDRARLSERPPPTETMAWTGLDRHRWWRELMEQVASRGLPALEPPALWETLQRWQRAGALLAGAPGRMQQQELLEASLQWAACLRRLDIEQLLEGGACRRLHWHPSALAVSDRSAQRWRPQGALLPWWAQQVAATEGSLCELLIVAPDGLLIAQAPAAASARDAVAATREALGLFMRSEEPLPADPRLVGLQERSPSEWHKQLDRVAERDPSWRHHFGTSNDWAWQPGSSGRPLLEWQQAQQSLYGCFEAWCGQTVRFERWGDPVQDEDPA